MNASAWLIRYLDRKERPAAVAHLHNAVGDYRAIDPSAASIEINLVGAANLIEAVESGLRFGMAFTDRAAGDAVRAALEQAKGGVT